MYWELENAKSKRVREREREKIIVHTEREKERGPFNGPSRNWVIARFAWNLGYFALLLQPLRKVWCSLHSLIVTFALSVLMQPSQLLQARNVPFPQSNSKVEKNSDFQKYNFDKLKKCWHLPIWVTWVSSDSYQHSSQWYWQFYFITCKYSINYYPTLLHREHC